MSTLQNKKRPQSAPKRTISIETYISNPNQSTKLNSPRTLEAIKQLGYSQEDIMYVPISVYATMDQTFRTLPHEMQKRRYETYNELRMNKIKEINEIRNQIEPSKLTIPTSSGQQRSTTQRSNVLANENVTSTAINEEKKQFEKMQRKNEMDLINMVEYELKRKIMIKEAEAKMRKQQMKLNDFQREKEAKHQIELAQKEDREKRLLLKQQEEEEENRRRDREKYMKEQMRLKEEAKKERERLRENKRKHEEQEKKRMEFEEKINKMNDEKQQRLYQKMEYLNQKEAYRQMTIEEQRKRKIEENNEKNKKKQEQIQRNMENLQKRLEEQRNNYVMKQEMNEEKKRRLDAKREEEMKQRAENARIRAENTKKVLETDKMIQQEKLDNYNKKQEMIAIKKQELEEINRKKEEERIRRNKEREERIKQILEKNQEIIQNRQMSTLEQIRRREKIAEAQLQKKNQSHMEWSEQNNEKMMLIQDNIRRLNRLNNLQRENTLKWINEKREKIETMKEQKQFMTERLSQIKAQIAKRKEVYDAQFQNMFHKKNIDEKMINKIIQMFPDNPSINALLNRLAELEEDEREDRRKEEMKKKQIEYELKQTKNSLKRSFNSTQLKSTSSEFKNKSSSKEDNILIQDKLEAAELSDSNTFSASSPKRTHISNLKTQKDSNRLSSPLASSNLQTHQEEKKENKKRPMSSTNKVMKKYNTTNNAIKKPKQKSERKPSSSEQFEIEKKLKEYQIQLSNDLLIFINEEKKKEAQRLDIYNRSSQNEKGELMRQLGEERAKSKMLILQKKE